MITLEGYNWSNNWSIFGKHLDDNIVYQFHYYCRNNPDQLSDITPFLEKQQQFNNPVWVGGTGSNGDHREWKEIRPKNRIRGLVRIPDEFLQGHFMESQVYLSLKIRCLNIAKITNNTTISLRIKSTISLILCPLSFREVVPVFL